MPPTSTTRPRLRFAPSPNGPLHLGHAYSVFRNLEIARTLGGDVLLRIDDIDQTRARKSHEEAIIKECAYLGMSVGEPLRRQSKNLVDYEAALEHITKQGLTYKSYASRKAIRQFVADQSDTWPTDPDGAPHFPKIAPFLEPTKAQPTPTSIRLDMQKTLAYLGDKTPTYFNAFDPETGDIQTVEIQPERWGDIALSTRDVAASYHLAVVVDDDTQAITHCVRGQDLTASTDIHRLLQALLGIEPPSYHHHRLIRDLDGRKLSKSDGDASLSHLINRGMSPKEIFALCKSQGAYQKL